MSLQAYVNRIVEQREVLSRADARTLLEEVLAGSTAADPGPQSMQLAAILSSLALRGATPGEIAGFVDAMRAAATPVPLESDERSLLVDTCGTGADASGTFNISTAAALVAAATARTAQGTGLMVAKHGNRAVTSACGSADVLEALGIPVGLSPAEGAAVLRRHRFAFLHAPSLHPAMKAVMPIRRALGIRTIFHLVGPLSNPAGARAQVMGVYSPHLVPIVAETMELLGVHHAFVVHGFLDDTRTAGMDEFSISGPSQFAEICGERTFFAELTPEMVGLTTAPIETLRGGDAATNAAILRSIFAGERGPRRDVVLLNSAAVLLAGGLLPVTDWLDALRAAIDLAARTIDSGAVTSLLTDLASVR